MPVDKDQVLALVNKHSAGHPSPDAGLYYSFSIPGARSNMRSTMRSKHAGKRTAQSGQTPDAYARPPRGGRVGRKRALWRGAGRAPGHPPPAVLTPTFPPPPPRRRALCRHHLLHPQRHLLDGDAAVQVVGKGSGRRQQEGDAVAHRLLPRADSDVRPPFGSAAVFGVFLGAAALPAPTMRLSALCVLGALGLLASVLYSLGLFLAFGLAVFTPGAGRAFGSRAPGATFHQGCS